MEGLSMPTNNTSVNTESRGDTISFRNKFRNLLKEDTIGDITNAFQEFCENFSQETAIRYLWNMTYLEGKVCFEAFYPITQKNTTELRNELRFQYEMQHPGFLKVEIPEECQEAFQNLAKRTDTITAKVVCGQCQAQLYLDDASVQRTLHLLSSDRENIYYGGLRALEFNEEEATYLKPYHMQIYDLLKVLYEAKRNDEASTNNSPFAVLGGIVKMAIAEREEDGKPHHPRPAVISSAPAVSNHSDTLKMPEEEQAQDQKTKKHACEQSQVIEYQGESQMDIKHKALTSDRIFEHAAQFKDILANNSMMSCLRALRSAGVDLNDMVDKAEKINALLTLADEINKST